MRKGMSIGEFSEWRRSWFERVPKCMKFSCRHELMSCAIDVLCGCGSIYGTYKRHKKPVECKSVSCADCMHIDVCRLPLKNRLIEQKKKAHACHFGQRMHLNFI